MMADRAQAMVRKAKELMEKEQSRRQEMTRCDRVVAWQLPFSWKFNYLRGKFTAAQKTIQP
jgi:methyl coenzyme M reductase subunit D